MADNDTRRYNIGKNMIDTPAHITFGQLLDLAPAVRQELRRGLQLEAKAAGIEAAGPTVAAPAPETGEPVTEDVTIRGATGPGEREERAGFVDCFVA